MYMYTYGIGTGTCTYCRTCNQFGREVGREVGCPVRRTCKLRQDGGAGGGGTCPARSGHTARRQQANTSARWRRVGINYIHVNSSKFEDSTGGGAGHATSDSDLALAQSRETDRDRHSCPPPKIRSQSQICFLILIPYRI